MHQRRPSEIQGLVWEDFNNDGGVNFGEKAIAGVTVNLSGTDDRGNAVSRQRISDEQDVYMFVDLRPGNYTISEVQPTSPVAYEDGKDVVGQINGITTGDHDGGTPPLSTANNQFTNVTWALPDAVGENYNFGEQPPAGGEVTPGQTATIGFWQNRNGQRLIESLNDGSDATQLAEWLGATFPNMYGANAGASNLLDADNNLENDQDGDGDAAFHPMSNEQVADFYRDLFRRKKRQSMRLGLTGPAKMDAQVMATALASYVTNETLAGTVANDYGFLVTEYGVGNSTFNVGDTGEAFGVADGTDMTVLDLLFATNDRAWQGRLYDLNQDGDTEDTVDDLDETLLRTLANDVYSAINEQGDI